MMRRLNQVGLCFGEFRSKGVFATLWSEDDSLSADYLGSVGV